MIKLLKKHLRRPSLSLLTAAGLLLSGESVAAEAPGIEWNAFGTLGAAWSDNNDADYRPNPLNPRGPGRRQPWDAGLDTRLAGQLTASDGDRLTGIVQVVVERNFDGNVKPQLEWANVSYQLTDAVNVRAGRIVLDTFLVSDHRKVGYTLPWVRPPAELYQLVSITNSDGVDIRVDFDRGHWHHNVSLNYGRNQMRDLKGYLSAPNLAGINWRVTSGPLTLQASYISYKLVYGQLDDVWDGFRQFGGAGEQVLQRYRSSQRRSVFTALAAQYDSENWFVMGEWGHSDLHSDFGSRAGWYLSSGLRLDRLTPYVTMARAQGGHSRVAGLDLAGLPAPFHPAAAQLNEALLQMQDGLAPRQMTVSAGLRWELAAGISTKLQIDRINPESASSGTFNNLRRLRDPGRTHVLSLTTDMVF